MSAPIFLLLLAASAKSVTPPSGGSFKLLNGQNFLLLNNSNFLLL